MEIASGIEIFYVGVRSDYQLYHDLRCVLGW